MTTVTNPATARGKNKHFVKLFDSFGRRRTVDEPSHAEEAAVAHHGDNLDRVIDGAERITIDEDQVGDCAGSDAPEARIHAEGRGRVHAARMKRLRGRQPGGDECAKFRLGADAGEYPVRAAAEDNRRLAVLDDRRVAEASCDSVVEADQFCRARAKQLFEAWGHAVGESRNLAHRPVIGWQEARPRHVLARPDPVEVLGLIVRRDDGRDARAEQQGTERLVSDLGQSRMSIDKAGEHGEIPHIDDDLARSIPVRFYRRHAPLRDNDIVIALVVAAQPVVEPGGVNDERARRLFDARQLASDPLDHALNSRCRITPPAE
jgi:hypothetical protein